MLRKYMNAGCFSKISCANVLNFAVSSPSPFSTPTYTPPVGQKSGIFLQQLN